MLESLSTFLLSNETVDHLKWKYHWFQKLTNQGFKCEFEKVLINPVTKEKLIVDVYGEKEKEITIVEIIHSSWSGKNPKPFISKRKRKNKKIHFIKQKTLTGVHKTKKEYTLEKGLKKRLVKVGNSYYISIPPVWIRSKIAEGKLKSERSPNYSQKEIYFLNMIISNNIIIKTPEEDQR